MNRRGTFRLVLQEYLTLFPELGAALSARPPRLWREGRWWKITDAHLTSRGLEVECGRLGTFPIASPRGKWAERATRLPGLVDLVCSLFDSPRILDVRWTNSRNLHQPAAFSRMLLRTRGGKVAVLAVFEGESPELSTRLASSAVLWWDRVVRGREAPREIVILVPWDWSRRITSLLKWMRLPVRCFRYCSEPRRAEQIFPLPTQVSCLDSPYVIYPMPGGSPDFLSKVCAQDRDLDLVFRSRRWELSYRGFPVLWGDEQEGYYFDYWHPVELKTGDLRPFWDYLAGVRLIRVFPSPYPGSPVFRFGSERWMESQVLRSFEQISPDFEDVVYCQVPTWLESDRKVLDLLTVTREGRVAVIELKVDRQVNLLFQGVDYWDRVRQHLLREDLERAGYFPGYRLTKEAPLLYLVSPVFEFHRVMPVMRQYLEADIRFECIGVNSDWRQGLKVLRRFRL